MSWSRAVEGSIVPNVLNYKLSVFSVYICFLVSLLVLSLAVSVSYKCSWCFFVFSSSFLFFLLFPRCFLHLTHTLFLFPQIWANQGGGQHKPPNELVFRQQSSWGTGKDIKTSVTDTNGKVRNTLCQFADEHEELHAFEIKLLAAIVGVNNYQEFL